jgi:hypothetical protein
MSIHDKMAYRAFIAGRKAEEFRHAAQKHANATWIYLIIAGIVWYFTSWIWALIPGALGTFTAIQSISATVIVIKLEKLESSHDIRANE